VQQPSGQVSAQPLHAPSRHCSVPQSAQSAPLLPQKWGSLIPFRQWPFEQQPSHRAWSQPQVPVEIRHHWSAPQAGIPPQVQTPSVQPLALSGSHWKQGLPLSPHKNFKTALQPTTGSQQPVGQLLLSQAQWSTSQYWPGAQAGKAPQTHWPSEQPLARSGSHAPQGEPPMPQRSGPGVWQVWRAGSQQPPQELPSQKQIPPLQCWPSWHAESWPQVHCPPRQPSARSRSQGWQAWPPVPQLNLLGWLQVGPVQQPSRHSSAQPAHTPPARHACPRQSWQGLPALAQAVVVVTMWQTLLASQQPVQVAPSQMQRPSTQCRLFEQGAPSPQRQLPSAEHLSAVSWLQGTQESPRIPQVAKVRGWQVRPSRQQPPAQETSLQMQEPLTHSWPGPQAATAWHRQAPETQAVALPWKQGRHPPPPVPQWSNAST
jgi:hypothetical protein